MPDNEFSNEELEQYYRKEPKTTKAAILAFLRDTHNPQMIVYGARATGGFLWHYKWAKGKRERLPEYWWRKRDAFIARHLVQYRNNPTYRRWLALVAWAYRPDRRFG